MLRSTTPAHTSPYVYRVEHRVNGRGPWSQRYYKDPDWLFDLGSRIATRYRDPGLLAIDERREGEYDGTIFREDWSHAFPTLEQLLAVTEDFREVMHASGFVLAIYRTEHGFRGAEQIYFPRALARRVKRVSLKHARRLLANQRSTPASEPIGR